MSSKKCTSDFSGRLNLIYGDIDNMLFSSAYKPLTELLSCWDAKDQLEKIKTITSQLKQDSELARCWKDILEVFVNIYLGNEAKHPVKRVIASCLQSLPVSFHEEIEHELCLRIRLHIFSVKTSTVPINQLRHNVNVINGLLDNFALGERCVQRIPVEVLSNLTECLETFITYYSPTLPPVEHNEVMHHCHVTLQTTNKTLQKCWDLLDRLQSTDPAINAKLTGLAQHIVTCSNKILKQDNFLRDACCTAGISLGLLVTLLHKDEVINLILRCVFPSFQTDFSNKVPDWLVKCGSCDLDLSLTSHLCVCHGLLGVLDGKDLMRDFNTKCLLIDVFFNDLIESTKVCLDTVTKILLAKALVAWTSRACSVVESFSKGDKPIDGFLGSGPLVQRLLTYVWTTWEDPIDALRLKSKQVFENTVKLHILAAKSDPREDPFLLSLITSLMNMSWSIKGKYSPLSCLVDYVGANQMIRLHPGLSADIIEAFKEQDLSCYANELFEKLCRLHLQEIKTNHESEGFWEKCWVDPVLHVLCSNHKTHKVHVLEYVLPRLLKVNKCVLSYMISSLSGENDKERGIHRLGALVMCLRRARAMGLLPHPVTMDTQSSSLMFGLIEFEVIKRALSAGDEQVRMDAFALLCESNKTSEFIQRAEFDLIKFFLHHNFNNQSPSFRQSLISCIKKLFVRMDESAVAILRLKSKAKESPNLDYYKDFNNWLLKELFSNLFSGASFPRTTLTLSLLHLLITMLNKNQKSNLPRKQEDILSALGPNHARSLVECFTDSFEENKIQAFEILNMLPDSAFPSQMNEWLKELFEAGLKLSVSTKPHDCSTAAYIFRFVITKKSSTSIILSYLQNRRDSNSDIPECNLMENHLAGSTSTENSPDAIKEINTFLLTSVLLKSLHDQLSVAKGNLLQAAATKPLYPTMHCIRYLLSNVSLSTGIYKKQWRALLPELIQCCFDVAEVVSPVVHNSSPEGNIPVEAIKGGDLIQMESTELMKNDTEAANMNQSEKPMILMPQYLIVCCWRSIKEVSLLLGDVALRTPIIDTDKGEITESVKGLISFEEILAIGQYFITQLLESKHRGAFELAYAGFVQMMEMLWRSPMKALRELPVKWLGQVMMDIQSEEGMSKLCATRRSAGVPFYVQAVVVTEPNIQGKQLFNQTMARLLELALETDKNLPANSDAQVHALNILRALYRDTRIGKDVALYVADGVKAALLGFTSPDWAIRNSSTLLFSALMTRIFGVKRSKDDSAISRKNCLNGRIFFHRYPSLYPFLLEQMEICTRQIGLSGKFELHPGLYPILLLLGRLVPSVMEGGDTSLSLAPFIPFVVRCASSPVMKTRLMAARALQPLVFKDQLTSVLTDLLEKLPTMHAGHMTQSHIHGILIQIKELMSSLDQLSSSLLETVAMAIQSRLMKSVWLLTRSNTCLVTRQAMLETVIHAVTILPTSANDLLALLSQVVIEEIASLDALTHHTPGMVDFSVSLAMAYLNTSITGLETCEKILTLLNCNLYEVRLVALEIFATTLKDFKREDSISDCPISGAEIGLNKFIPTSDALVQKLKAMLLEQETWTDCLQKTLDVLARLVEIDGIGVQEEVPPVMFQRVMFLAKTSYNVELKASAINLSGTLFKHFYRSFSTQPDDNSKNDILPSWVTLIKDCSQVEQSDDVKLAVANIVLTNSTQLLLDPQNVLGLMTLTFWEVTFDLLQEDDRVIKEVMNSVLPTIDQSISDPAHAIVTIDLLLDYFIQSQLPKYPESGLRFLFGLMTKEDNSVFDGEEKVFDKGEMNPFKEEVIISRLVNQHIRHWLIGLKEINGCGLNSEEGCHSDGEVGNCASNLKMIGGQIYQKEAGCQGDRCNTKSDQNDIESELSSTVLNSFHSGTSKKLDLRICSKHLATILDDITDTVCERIESILENDKDFSLSKVYLNTATYEDSVSLISRLVSCLHCVNTSKLCSRADKISTIVTKTKHVFNLNNCNNFIFELLQEGKIVLQEKILS